MRCENHPRPWRIAEFGKGIDGPGWVEIAGTSRARREEQARRQAEVDAMPPRRDDDLSDWIARVIPGGDRPVHVVELEDGTPVDSSLRAAARAGYLMERALTTPDQWPAKPRERWKTYDLTCPRCKKAKRHATYRRREDALFAIFDELVALDVTTVTPELLHAYETRRAARDAAT